MRKSWLAAAVLMTASVLWADVRPGIVRTKDGGVYDGTVDEQDSKVVVTVRGIDTTLDRDNIVSIVYGDFEERWTADYAKIDSKDAKAHVAAARRAFDERRYDLAEKALHDAQAIDPTNPEAAELLRSTINQEKLERNQPAPGTGAAAPTTPELTVKPAAAFNTLSADQINRVKQLEAHDGDTKLRINFANGVRKRFYDATPSLASTYSSYNDFAKQPSITQAVRIIQDGSPDMAKDVKVTNDPEMIAAFRGNVMPLVLLGCATSQCHGGTGIGAEKFALISPATDAAAVYTNFYVLESKKLSVSGAATPGAQPGGSTVQPNEAYVFDRSRADQSLVLQYGLPDSMAQLKHPHVRGYNGIFRGGRDDPKYKTILAFLQTLNPVQPEYGIDFKLQRKDATTQP